MFAAPRSPMSRGMHRPAYFRILGCLCRQCRIGSPTQWAFLCVCTIFLAFTQLNHQIISHRGLYTTRHLPVSNQPDPSALIDVNFCQLPALNTSEAGTSAFISSMTVDRNTWGAFMGARLYCLESELKYDGQPVPRIPLCIHGDDADVHFSRKIINTGKSITQSEYNFMRKLGPCSSQRPVFLDIGAGVGSAAVLAGHQGCDIIAFEPSSANAGRLLRNLKDNNLMRRATVYKNAAAGTRDKRFINWSRSAASSGTVSVFSASDVSEEVYSVLLDDFFLYDGRPSVANLSRLVLPRDVGTVWIDVDGNEMSALFSMAMSLQVGEVPIVRLTLRANGNFGEGSCDAIRFLRFMKALAYVPFMDGTPVGYPTLQEWIASAAAAGIDEKARTHDGDSSDIAQLQVWFVRQEVAVEKSLLQKTHLMQ